MKKNIMIINADREAAQIVKANLTCSSTNILCVSSIHEALQTLIRTKLQVDNKLFQPDV